MTRSTAREIAVHLIFSLGFGTQSAEEVLDSELTRERFEELGGESQLYAQFPNENSVIAAKLVLDGGVVEETKGATHFDSCSNSWASRHKTCVAVIGGHRFYA